MVFEQAEERAAEREERMRKMELEMQEKISERTAQREERMYTMFSTLMQQMTGSGVLCGLPPPAPTYHRRVPYHTPSPYPPSDPYAPDRQQSP